jgi:hypothetical protein
MVLGRAATATLRHADVALHALLDVAGFGSTGKRLAIFAYATEWNLPVSRFKTHIAPLATPK